MGSRIVDSSSGYVLAADARWARSRKERRIGLIGSDPLNNGEGLIIVGGFQVHTFQMTFPIDVVFCNKAWTVKHVEHSMVPGRMSRIVWGARYAIELPSGSVPKEVIPGAQLIIS
jgi:uncharacterized membrane protein (UPF0127 family)